MPVDDTGFDAFQRLDVDQVLWASYRTLHRDEAAVKG
jgi:hypothetical protein